MYNISYNLGGGTALKTFLAYAPEYSPMIIQYGFDAF